jgi:hypothetical protein
MHPAGSTTSAGPVAAPSPAAVPEPPAGHVRDESALLRRIVTMCGHMSAQAAQGTGIDTIARLLFDDIGSTVLVLDRGLEVVASAGTDAPQEDVIRLREQGGPSGLNTLLAAAARNRRALTMPMLGTIPGWVVVAPVSVGDGVAAYVVTIGERTHELNENLRLMVIEHAAMICGVVLSREVVVAAAAGRARQQLFEGLLLTRNRDDEELDRWARHLGLDPTQAHQVITVTLPEPGRVAGLPSVETLLIRIAPTAVVVGRTDEVVAVVPAGSDAATVAEQCVVAADRRRLGPLAVGIGNLAPTTATIARSHAEARLALAASERMGDFGGVTHFADLGIQRLLLRVPDLEDLRSFADSVIGKLIDGASNAGQEFLDTLAVYFAENGSLQRTAKRLHVHPNTVTYRIRRVEEITGLALHVHRDRLMAEVAVEIVASMGGRR